MKGNTSRQWPEYWYDEGGDNWTAKPKRFSFGIKFDEEFDEDEGVYACIDATGEPAAVEGAPCYLRVGKDHAEVPENDKESLWMWTNSRLGSIEMTRLISVNF